MTEIDKMFENAGIEPIYPYTKCYPFFSAEKQLELICFIVNRKIECRVIFDSPSNTLTTKDIAYELAEHLNNLWQDLTDQEKEEIKRILK